MDSFWDKVDTKFKLKLDKNILTLEETSNGSLVFTVNLDRSVEIFSVSYTFVLYYHNIEVQLNLDKLNRPEYK